MSVRIVRLYKGESGGGDVIGFSYSAYPEKPRILEKALGEWGYQFRWVEPMATPKDTEQSDWADIPADADPSSRQPEGSCSYSHLEVRPPLAPEHTKRLGELCTGRNLDGTPPNMMVDGELVAPLIDDYHDGTRVIDNRQELPGERRVGGVLIAAC